MPEQQSEPRTCRECLEIEFISGQWPLCKKVNGNIYNIDIKNCEPEKEGAK
jgi:hypothetical protein